MREVYPRRGWVNWNRLAFGVGKGRVPEDSLSKGDVLTEIIFANFIQFCYLTLIECTRLPIDVCILF